MSERFQILRPALPMVDSYAAALAGGWLPVSTRPDCGREHLEAIGKDPAAFVSGLYDPDARGAPITLPDGTQAPRLPGYLMWMWDGDFCGSIGLRWQRGTPALPPYVLGHIGYTVVPWKQRRGYASKALAQLLPLARQEGLPYVELTTDPDNAASQKVITSNGGVLVEAFTKGPDYGGTPGLRFRIALG
jgi:predicted acetyltransferase